MKELDTNKKNMLTEKLGSSIEKLMGLHHINMHQLHKNTGVPLTTINRIINDKNVNPTITSLIPIADFFGITLNQLMGIDPLDSDLLVGIYARKRDLWTDVPIVTWEQAAEWPLNSASLTINNVISTDVTLGAHPFALLISETNWEGFFPNSIIIADATFIPEHSDYVVVLKAGQKRTSLKQILIDDDKTYLRPVNKDYQTTLMDESYKLLGVVVQIRMDRR
jgi:SOS-response transcriptional repressor LexA